VHEADGVGDDTMLAFARETGLSETTFVQAAEGADYRNRIFTTLGEIRLGGHPTLGTAVAEALRRGDREARYVQETPAGRQPVDVSVGADGRSARGSMLLEPATFGPELDPAAVLAIAGLEPADAAPDLPVQVVGCGQPQVLAPVRAEALDRAAVHDPDALLRLMREHEAVVLYLAAVDGERAAARSFLPEAGGGSMEDPATGAGAAPLMAHVHARLGAERLTVDQGVAMGRPSRLDCAVEADGIRVGGACTVVATGTVHLP